MKKEFTIKPHNISILNEDINDFKKEIKSIYIIDTYDIVEYCFPLITQKDISVETINNVNNFHKSYYNLFNNEVCLLFNEYSDELERYKSKLEFLEKFSYSYNEFYRQLKKEAQDIDNFVSKYLGVLISIYLGLDGSGSVNKYNNLINGKLGSNRIELKNKADEKILNNILEKTKPDHTTNRNFFKYYVNKYESDFYYKSKEYRYNNLKKTLTDINVIDRTIKINLLLKENDLNKKYRFKLLSSTPKRTERLAKSYLFYIKQIRHKKFIPIRKIENFYLFETFKAQSEKINKTINIVSDTNEDIYEADEKSSSDGAIEFIQQKESNLVNNLFHIDERTVKLLNLIKESKKETKGRNELYTDINNYISKIKHKDAFKLIGLNNYNLSAKTFNLSQLNNKIISLPLSKDAIKSHIQSFPILLLDYKLFYDSNYKRWLLDLIDPLEYDSKSNYIYKSKFLDINTTISSLNHFQIDLFLTFLGLIMSNYTYHKDIDPFHNSINVYGQIVKFEEDFKSMLNPSEKGEKLDIKIDFIYFKLWVLRREKKFNEALKIIYSTDISRPETLNPKILHCIGLVYYSYFYSLIEKNYADILEEDLSEKISKEIMEQIEQSKLFLKIALQKFEKKLSSNSEKLSSLIYKSIVIGIENTLSDIDAQSYWITKDPNIRNKFVRVNNESEAKKHFNSNVKTHLNEKYDDYPAYNHTEFDIELCELDQLIKNNKSKEDSEILMDHIKKRRQIIKNNLLLKNHKHLSEFSFKKYYRFQNILE